MRKIPQTARQTQVDTGDLVRAGGRSGIVTGISWSMSEERWLVTVDNGMRQRITFREDEVLLLERRAR